MFAIFQLFGSSLYCTYSTVYACIEYKGFPTIHSNSAYNDAKDIKIPTVLVLMRASVPSSLADILDGHLEGGVAVVPEPGALWQVESRRSFPSGQEVRRQSKLPPQPGSPWNVHKNTQ